MVPLGQQKLCRHGLALELLPRRFQFSPHLRDAAGGHAKLFGRRLGRLARRQNLRDLSPTPWQRPEPLREVDPSAGRIGWPGVATVAACAFIDCSYEGDLMVKAGVSYTWGRESRDG